MLAKMYILNAPYLFSGAWSVIKKFLDERTRNKIEICRKGQYSDLFEQADPANIPAFLGGTCRCP